jgi:hypothetical protein
MARRRGHAGIELEKPVFYRDILTYPLDHSSRNRPLRDAALVLLSQMATAFGALREWIAPDEGWRGRATNDRLTSNAPSTIP